MQPALADRGRDGWQTLTWGQVGQQALELAAGFIALGLAPGDRVALMLPNRSEHVLADLGAVHAGGVPVTFYATLAAEQVGFMAGDCDARIAVLDGAEELARWQPVLASLPGLQKVIVRDAAACPPGELYLSWADFAALGRGGWPPRVSWSPARVAAISPDDPVTLLYTSGTTGNPKGVRDHPPQRPVRGGGRAPGREHPRGRPLGVLPAAGAHRRAHVQHLHRGHDRRACAFLP